MKSNFETQDELSGCIPNPAGMPCNENESGKIRKEHNRWKSTIRQKRMESQPAVSYWRSRSSCVSL